MTDNKQVSATAENRQTASGEANDRGASDIGTGKKVGLYGGGFLLAAFVIIIIVLIITGMFEPFSSSEGVGP